MPNNDDIRAGELRHRLTIQNLVETADTFGGANTESWVTLATVWADIRQLIGNELMRAQQVESQVTTRIRIRYIEGLKARCRGYVNAAVGTVIYDVLAVIHDGRKRWIELQTVRRNA
jgi:SPP1 family predicted phage head-tail adaptor